jgi:hypothetical protein
MRLPRLLYFSPVLRTRASSGRQKFAPNFCQFSHSSAVRANSHVRAKSKASEGRNFEKGISFVNAITRLYRPAVAAMTFADDNLIGNVGISMQCNGADLPGGLQK